MEIWVRRKLQSDSINSLDPPQHLVAEGGFPPELVKKRQRRKEHTNTTRT